MIILETFLYLVGFMIFIGLAVIAAVFVFQLLLGAINLTLEVIFG